MRQRVAIAIALSCEPKLLIADEPTTALDVTIQAQILDLLAREQRRRHMAMILITHDLGVVAGRTDEVAVMYAGRVVERAPTPALFKKMRMPYTEALLAALPKLDAAPHTPLPAIAGRPPDPTRPLQGCSFSPRCRYAVARCHAEKPALDGGRVARTSIRLLPPDRNPCGGRRMMLQAVRPLQTNRCSPSTIWSSNIPSAARSFMPCPACPCRSPAARRWAWWANPAAENRRWAAPCCSCAGRPRGGCCSTATISRRCRAMRMRLMRRRLQLIFQDPIASLNPRRRIGDIVAEPLVIAGVKDPAKREQLVHEVLSAVGLDPDAGRGTAAA